MVWTQEKIKNTVNQLEFLTIFTSFWCLLLATYSSYLFIVAILRLKRLTSRNKSLLQTNLRIILHFLLYCLVSLCICAEFVLSFVEFFNPEQNNLVLYKILYFVQCVLVLILYSVSAYILVKLS